MRFSKNLYRKARRHYVARAQELRAIRERAQFDATFGDPLIANWHYRHAASMARKIVERGNREKGMYKYAVGKK